MFARVYLKCIRRMRFKLKTQQSGMTITKVICVGRNKTGTTSLEAFFTKVGYCVAPQHEGERLIFEAGFEPDDKFWAWMDKYEVFQDVPFSQTWFLPELVQRYPTAKFILTVREENAWYTSLTNHIFEHLGVSSEPSGINIVNAMKKDSYIAPGYAEALYTKTFGECEPGTVYDRVTHIRALKAHNSLVRELIDQSRLLELDVSAHGASEKICDFLGLPSELCCEMPWMNKRR